MSRPLAILALLVGVVFLALAAYYWLTPAGGLPSFLPGYEPGGTGHHLKHAILSLVVALALFALAWFQSKPAKA